MAHGPDVSPGTVSKILWHFTGGPVWNPVTKRQGDVPKPAAQAYDNLRSIIKSRRLRLGTYKELVTVTLPEYRTLDRQTRKLKIRKNYPITIESSSICCLSDIPAPHLRYHAYRYGRFALGFHREAVIRAGFNPVLYTLTDTRIIRSIHQGFSSLQVSDLSSIRDATHSIESAIGDFEAEHDDTDLYVTDDVWAIQSEVDSVEDNLAAAKHSLEDFVAFVKTFRRREFSTIYCEREWRSTHEFRFNIDDLAMLVIPRVVGAVHYFRNFVERAVPALRLPRRIPVVAWEDLVEH